MQLEEVHTNIKNSFNNISVARALKSTNTTKWLHL